MSQANDVSPPPADGVGISEQSVEFPVDSDNSTNKAAARRLASDSSYASSMGDDWRISLDNFSNAKRGSLPGDRRRLNRSLRRYYKRQDLLIKEYEAIYDIPEHCDARDDSDPGAVNAERDRITAVSARVSFALNFLLFSAKLLASILSGSLSIVSSLVDSVVDLVSGIVMWCTNSQMSSPDYYKYPGGKRRMEPLAVLILSVIMAMASTMVIIKSVETIQNYATENTISAPKVELVTIIIISSTIAIKFGMYIVMCRIKIPSVQALSQDHRNDVLSNIVALAMAFVGSKYWVYADPVGAILISVYIVGSWTYTAYLQIRMLAGKSAKPDFHKKVLWISLNHDPQIEKLDSITAFHFGNNFLVEVHIVMSGDMTVRQAHDVQESLQQKLEHLDEIERAFVHVDYESTHALSSEHKRV